MRNMEEYQLARKQILEEFQGKFREFLELYTTDEVHFAELVQECLGFSLMYIYVNADNPEQVDFFVRKMKQLAAQEREEIFNDEELIH